MKPLAGVQAPSWLTPKLALLILMDAALLAVYVATMRRLTANSDAATAAVKAAASDVREHLAYASIDPGDQHL